MKKETTNTNERISTRVLPQRSTLDEKAERYLREGGKLEDMPEGKLKDEHPQKILKILKEKTN